MVLWFPHLIAVVLVEVTNVFNQSALWHSNGILTVLRVDSDNTYHPVTTHNCATYYISAPLSVSFKLI